MSGELVEAGCTVGLPQTSTGAGSYAAVPEMSVEMGSSTITPQESRGASPSAQEQGAGLKWPRPNEVE